MHKYRQCTSNAADGCFEGSRYLRDRHAFVSGLDRRLEMLSVQSVGTAGRSLQRHRSVGGGVTAVWKSALQTKLGAVLALESVTALIHNA